MSACGECGGELFRAFCARCGTWSATGGIRSVGESDFVDMSKVPPKPVDRIRIGFWDLVWGPPHDPGFIPTDCHLLAGFPGAGKTTLLLMLSLAFAVATGKPTYYVCSEQGLDDLRRTLDRLALPIKEGQLRVLAKSGTGANVDPSVFRKTPPGMVALDSLSDFCGAKNRDAQMTLCKIYRGYAKEFRAPTLIINQISKQEDLVGSMELQHCVDGIFGIEVLSTEPRRLRRVMREFDCGDLDDVRSILAYKNRNGVAMVDHPLAMTGTGLVPLERIPPKKEASGKGASPLVNARLERAELEDALEAARADIAALRKEIAATDESSLRAAIREARKPKDRRGLHAVPPPEDTPPEGA